jgi:MFS family permease
MADGADQTTRSERVAQFDAEVEANLRRNMVANFAHGMLGMTGFRIIYAPTIIPAYLHLISGSAVIVGLGQALLQLGLLSTPLASAAALEHRKRILPAAMRYGSAIRGAVLGLALSGYFLGGWWLVAATLLFLMLLGLFNGMQRVAFQMVIAKLIPADRRGRLQGWRNLAGGIVAAILSFAAGKWLIDANAFGNGYATTFLCAFLLTSLGLVALGLWARESDAPVVREQVSVRQRMRDIPSLLADRDYRWFMTAQLLAMAGRIAAPFYILIATGAGHGGNGAGALTLDGATIGLLSFAFLGADTLSNPVWGSIGDRNGYRGTIIASLGFTFAGIALLGAADAAWMGVAAFAAFGIGGAGFSLSTQTMVLEFGEREDLPMRIALSTMVEGGVAALTPLIGGAMLLWAGSGPLLATAAVLTSAAALLMLAKVRDPRALRQA